MPRIDDSSRRWWILAAMGGSIGLILLDETIVGVALPSIQRELGLSQVATHWVVNAYLLVLAGLAAAGGRLGDIIGLRVLFVAGVAIFGGASLVCGFAESGAWLIGARAVQGIGGAVIFPASMAMVTIVFPEDERGVALGIYGAIGTTFLCLGPLVGGLFTDLLSWRWIFWVNPAFVVVVALIVLAAWVDPPQKAAREKFDGIGLLTLIGGLGMVIFAIMQGPEWGWETAAIWLLLIAGAALLAAFTLAELRIKPPLIEVDLFANISFTACNLVIFMAQFSKIAVIVMGALYFQHVQLMSPLGAGFAILAAVGPEPFMAVPAGRIADRFGARRPALASLLLTALALLSIGVGIEWSSNFLIFTGLVFWGACQPVLFVPALRAVMNSVPVQKQGQASGIVLTVQLIGGTIGMATCGTLLAMTDDFGIVFLTTGALALAILVLGWLAIERDTAPAHVGA